MAAARERGAGEVAVWLAGVAGAGRARSRRIVVQRGGDATAAGAADRRAEEEAVVRPVRPRVDPGAATEPLSVAQVAAAVDAGRDLAAAAAADGIAILLARAPGPRDPARSLHATASGPDDAARSLHAALAADESRPLRALRHHGTEQIATLCGVALGAGERGLGCVCDGIAAVAGAAAAAAIEPALRARLRALSDHELAERLGIPPIDATQLQAALD